MKLQRHALARNHERNHELNHRLSRQADRGQSARLALARMLYGGHGR